MIQINRSYYAGLLAMLMAAFLSTPAAAQPAETPVAEAPEEALVVRDVAVWISDAYGGKLNDRRVFDSTLPRFVRTRRPAEELLAEAGASPIGVMTFQGEVGSLLDVLIEIDKGSLLGGWPAKPRRNRLLWADLEMLDDLKRAPALPDGHWLTTLRDAPRLAALSGNIADRFLVYDVEFEHSNDIKLVAKDGEYVALYFGESAVHDVTLYKPVEGGWQVGHAGTIKAPAPEVERDADEGGDMGTDAARPEPEEAEPEEAEDDTPKPGPNFTIQGNCQPFGEFSASLIIEELDPKPMVSIRDCENNNMRSHLQQMFSHIFQHFSYNSEPDPENPGPAYEQVAEHVKQNIGFEGSYEIVWDEVNELPEWNDEDGVAAEVAMSDEVLDKDTVMASWAQILTDQGMGEPEVQHTLAVLRDSALDTRQMTAVYRLDPADHDELLPIEVTPSPTRLSRVALVILINASPDMAGQVEELIVQLGDPSWKVREAAHKRLLEIGPGARKSLEKALSNGDMEIVYRAEQLLDAIRNPTR